ncbi:putative acetyltransferase, partial [Salmonella enterica subsp. enterica serovar Meleagridis]
ADCAAITEIYNHAVLHTAAIWNDRTVDTDNRLAWYEARQLLGYPVLVSEENGVVTGYASFGDWRSFDGFSLYRRALGLCSSGAPGERTGAKAAQQTDRRSPTLRQACDGGRY